MMQQYQGLKADYPDALLFTAGETFTGSSKPMPQKPPHRSRGLRLVSFATDAL